MKFIAILLFSAIPFVAECKAALRVVFINPGFVESNDSGDFWPNVNHFMKAAANDLGIELISLHADRNHILMKQLVKQAVAFNPDYLVLVNEKEMLPQMMKQLEGTDLKVFLLLNKFNREQRKDLSSQQVNQIVGCLSPNNRDVGEQLAEALIKRAEQGENAELAMFALLGDYKTPAAKEREAGLLKALERYPNVQLIDSTVANWSEQEAFEKTYGVLSKHQADIVWAANDAMAFGAISALNELGKKNAIVVGGINWDIHAKRYQTDVSYGGHVTLGAKALLMIYDQHFYPERAQVMSQQLDIFESSQTAVNKPFLKILKDKKFDDIDFAKFSVKEKEPLTFNLENILASMQ